MTVKARTTERSDELADGLLERLRRKPGERISRSSLRRKFSVTDERIDRAIGSLLEWGYIIRSRTDGIEFERAPDALLQAEITHGLKTKEFGRPTHAYRKVKSTITIASSLAGGGGGGRAGRAGAPEGTLVVAEEQSAGRGRLGRGWHSPPGVGAYLSLILRPKMAAADTPALSIVTALALAEAIEELTGLPAQVKWPNDVLVRGKKVAGILTSMTAEGERVNYVIASAGLNINQTRQDFPSSLSGKAASLRMLLRHKVDRPALTRRFLEIFERRYGAFARSGFAPLRKKVLSRFSLLDRWVRVTDAAAIGIATRRSSTTRGKVIDIDRRGRLLVKSGAEELALIAGEVTLEESYH
ncbi:MAG: biotin--[acetyl-CoA-carboxylase] ligase [Candidatus Zixiibacteriota bacterium]